MLSLLIFPVAYCSNTNPGLFTNVPLTSTTQSNGQVTAYAQPYPSVGPTTGSLQTRGLPIGTSSGIEDSQIACAQGDTSACTLPNVAWVGNPNPALAYQTPLSNQLLTSLYATGNYNAFGGTNNVGTNLNTVQIPFAVNQGGLSTGGIVNSLNNAPVALSGQVNTVTLQNPYTSLLPASNNRYLPQSSYYIQSNLAPYSTVPSSGFVPSTLNAPTPNNPYPFGYNYANYGLSQNLNAQTSGLNNVYYNGLNSGLNSAAYYTYPGGYVGFT
jgi:hypothetical protein